MVAPGLTTRARAIIGAGLKPFLLALALFVWLVSGGALINHCVATAVAALGRVRATYPHHREFAFASPGTDTRNARVTRSACIRGLRRSHICRLSSSDASRYISAS